MLVIPVVVRDMNGSTFQCVSIDYQTYTVHHGIALRLTVSSLPSYYNGSVEDIVERDIFELDYSQLSIGESNTTIGWIYSSSTCVPAVFTLEGYQLEDIVEDEELNTPRLTLNSTSDTVMLPSISALDDMFNGSSVYIRLLAYDEFGGTCTQDSKIKFYQLNNVYNNSLFIPILPNGTACVPIPEVRPSQSDFSSLEVVWPEKPSATADGGKLCYCPPFEGEDYLFSRCISTISCDTYYSIAIVNNNSDVCFSHLSPVSDISIPVYFTLLKDECSPPHSCIIRSIITSYLIITSDHNNTSPVPYYDCYFENEVVELLSYSATDVEYLLVCDDDEDYTDFLQISLLNTISQKTIGSDKYMDMDIFCNESFRFSDLQPDTNYTLVMVFGEEEQEEEKEKKKCRHRTTFRTMKAIDDGSDGGGGGGAILSIVIMVIFASLIVILLCLVIIIILSIICISKSKPSYNLDNNTSSNNTNIESESHEIYNVLSFPDRILRQSNAKGHPSSNQDVVILVDPLTESQGEVVNSAGIYDVVQDQNLATQNRDLNDVSMYSRIHGGENPNYDVIQNHTTTEREGLYDVIPNHQQSRTVTLLVSDIDGNGVLVVSGALSPRTNETSGGNRLINNYDVIQLTGENETERDSGGMNQNSITHVSQTVAVSLNDTSSCNRGAITADNYDIILLGNMEKETSEEDDKFRDISDWGEGECVTTYHNATAIMEDMKASQTLPTSIETSICEMNDGDLETNATYMTFI